MDIVSDDDDLMLNQTSLIDIKYTNSYQINQDRNSKSDHRNETKISKDIDDLDNYSGGLNRLEIGDNIELYGGEEEQDNQINLWDKYQELNHKQQEKEPNNDVEMNDADNDNICDDLFGEDSDDEDFGMLPLDQDVLDKI